MTADIYVKQNDTAAPATGVLTDGDGAAVNIENATLRFIMVPLEGGTPKVEAAANNEQVGNGSDGSMGAWSYDWQATETDTAGYFKAEVEVTYQDGGVQTFPNDGWLYVLVTAELG